MSSSHWVEGMTRWSYGDMRLWSYGHGCIGEPVVQV
jgi:hypothetical protein